MRLWVSFVSFIHFLYFPSFSWAQIALIIIKSTWIINLEWCSGNGTQETAQQGREGQEEEVGRSVLLYPGLTFGFGTNPWGPSYTSCQLEDGHCGYRSWEATAGRTSRCWFLLRVQRFGLCCPKASWTSDQMFSEFCVTASPPFFESSHQGLSSALSLGCRASDLFFAQRAYWWLRW